MDKTSRLQRIADRLELTKLVEKASALLTEALQRLRSDLERLKERVTGIDNRLQLIEAIEVRDGRDGVDGKDGEVGPIGPVGPVGPIGPKGEKGDRGPKGDKGERGAKGEKGLAGVKGKDGKDGKDGKEIRPTEIVEKLESLEGEKRLDAKAIKNLPESVERIETRVERIGSQAIRQFRKLTDTPPDYKGHAGKAVVVKEDEKGLEFGVAIGGGGRYVKWRLSEVVDLEEYEQYNVVNTLELAEGGEIALQEGSQVNIINTE
jgi:predicted nuclease with TOPRIM domain